MVDWTPVTLGIYAYDADNHSIVSADMPGMTLTYQDKTYTVQEAGEDFHDWTKALPAIFYGFLAVTDGKGEPYLYFGEIDGARDYDEDIVLHWPDGSEDTIHYHCSNHREWPTVDCNRYWQLNGQPHEGSRFTFRGKSLPEPK